MDIDSFLKHWFWSRGPTINQIKITWMNWFCYMRIKFWIFFKSVPKPANEFNYQKEVRFIFNFWSFFVNKINHLRYIWEQYHLVTDWDTCSLVLEVKFNHKPYLTTIFHHTLTIRKTIINTITILFRCEEKRYFFSGFLPVQISTCVSTTITSVLKSRVTKERAVYIQWTLI